MWTQLPGKASLVGHRVKATCSGWVLWEPAKGRVLSFSGSGQTHLGRSPTRK